MVKGHELGPDEVSDRQASACPDTPGELGERHVKLLRRQVDQREPRKDSTETAVPLIKSSGVAEPKLETVVRATRLAEPGADTEGRRACVAQAVREVARPVVAGIAIMALAMMFVDGRLRIALI